MNVKTTQTHRSGIITVHRIRPDSELPLSDDQPTDADRLASAMIQSDDPLVRELADGISSAKDAWSTAIAVEKFVHRYLTQKNFSTAFATAARPQNGQQATRWVDQAIYDVANFFFPADKRGWVGRQIIVCCFLGCWACSCSEKFFRSGLHQGQDLIVTLLDLARSDPFVNHLGSRLWLDV